MPIIKAKKKIDKEQVRVSIDNDLMDKIKQYCEWAGVKKLDEFFEQAAEYILTKDKGWIKHTKDKNLLVSVNQNEQQTD